MKPVDFGLEYWSQGGPTGFVELKVYMDIITSKFLGQYVINNPDSTNSLSSGTLQRFNFEVIDDQQTSI